MAAPRKHNSDRFVQERAWWVCVALVVLFSMLSGRLIYLQVVKHEAFAKETELYYLRQEKLPSQRGSIYDRNGDLLACNQTVYTLYADKNHLRDYNIACRGLATAKNIGTAEVRRLFAREDIPVRYEEYVARMLYLEIGWDRRELENRFHDKDRGVIYLKRGIEEDERRRLRRIMKEAGIGGVHFQRESQRFYPSSRRLTHVLGYVNLDNEGQEGVEKTMDETLRGKDGFRYVERDNAGREIAAYRGEVVPAVDGNDVHLTIDKGIQNIVERVLDLGVDRFRPEKMCAIFMDPNTGEILALANRPHFDLTTREGNRRNWAVADQYEPGSTFKIVTLGAAFDQRLVRLNTQVFCHNQYYEEDGLIVKDHHPYGELTVQQVMAKSSNIGTYKIARQLGGMKFYQYMKRFGFGAATGIELTSEIEGNIFHPDNWSRPSFSAMTRGYEVGVTPLQMLSALGVVANGGELLKPRIVKSVTAPGGDVIEETSRTVVRRVISPEAASLTRRTLMAVVSDEGTGELGSVPGFRVAGKTATSRKYSVELNQYLEGRYVVSFMGFLPADDPKIMGLVVVDDPVAEDLQLYGGTIAAPLFAEMARQIAGYLDLSPTRLDLVQSVETE